MFADWTGFDCMRDDEIANFLAPSDSVNGSSRRQGVESALKTLHPWNNFSQF